MIDVPVQIHSGRPYVATSSVIPIYIGKRNNYDQVGLSAPQAVAKIGDAANRTPSIKGSSLRTIPGFSTPRNGATWSGGEIGKASDIKGAAYPASNKQFDGLIAMGAKAIRFPVRYNRVAPGGVVSKWHLDKIVACAKYVTSKGVAFIIDDHSYRPMDTPAIGEFWADFGKQFETAMGGTNDLVLLELQNEPKTNWAAYGHGLKANIARIRGAGVKSTLVIDWGLYSKYSDLDTAIARIDMVGGVKALDPLNRLLFAAHDYWEPGGNDQSNKTVGNINFSERYAEMIATARANGISLVMGEVGMGGGTKGWLPSNGKGTKNGRDLFSEYTAWASANADVIKGTWAWGGGRLNPRYSYHVSPHSEVGRALSDFWKAPQR